MLLAISLGSRPYSREIVFTRFVVAPSSRLLPLPGRDPGRLRHEAAVRVLQLVGVAKVVAGRVHQLKKSKEDTSVR